MLPNPWLSFDRGWMAAVERERRVKLTRFQKLREDLPMVIGIPVLLMIGLVVMFVPWFVGAWTIVRSIF